MDNLHG